MNPLKTCIKQVIAIILIELLIVHTSVTALGVSQHKIMCLGDSITESEKRENSWRYMLVQKLYENGYKGKFDMVGRNCGFFNNADTDWDSEHCGYYSASASNLLNGGLPRGRASHGCIKDWAPKYKPTIALIHLGTNDSRGGRNPESTLKIIEGIIGHLRMAVPEVKIVVAQIIPIGVSGA
ncbi:MAG: GDSL-type esterase/lipase family protein, partial [Chitinispirillia bacterium]